MKQANEICNDGRSKALATSSTKDPIKEGVLPAIDSSVDRLRSLELPGGEEERIEAILDQLQADVDQAMNSDIADLPELEDYFEKSAASARRYGIPGCAFA